MEGQQPPRLGEVKADPKADGVAHTQIRWDEKNNRVYQAREFNNSGEPTRDIDFTAPTYNSGKVRPGHPIPHQHNWVENPSGGNMKRSNLPQILQIPDIFNQ